MTKINSPIADEAKNIYKKEALGSIHDDLYEGYYNRVNDIYDGYNPEDYGFRLMTEEDRDGLPENNWMDPLVEDLLDNYPWDSTSKFMTKINEEHPELFELFMDEIINWERVRKEMDEEDE